MHIVIALQFFELLTETGNQQYIIQKSTLSDDDLNTAWSMDILAKTGMALIIVNQQVSSGFIRLVWLCAPSMAGSLTGLIAVGLFALDPFPLLIEFLARGSLYVVIMGLITYSLTAFLLKDTKECSQLCGLYSKLQKKHPDKNIN